MDIRAGKARERYAGLVAIGWGLPAIEQSFLGIDDIRIARDKDDLGVFPQNGELFF